MTSLSLGHLCISLTMHMGMDTFPLYNDSLHACSLWCFVCNFEGAQQLAIYSYSCYLYHAYSLMTTRSCQTQLQQADVTRTYTRAYAHTGATIKISRSQTQDRVLGRAWSGTKTTCRSRPCNTREPRRMADSLGKCPHRRRYRVPTVRSC